MIDLDKDRTAQGLIGALLAAAAWIFTKLRLTAKEERPLVDSQRQRLVDALVELQNENVTLKGRVGVLELEIDNARREKLQLNTRIRDVEWKVERLDKQSSP